MLTAVLICGLCLMNPTPAESSCATGVAVPPFLAAGVDPNLLLMIDNSASMYDLAYVKPREEGYCYDGTYTDEDGNPAESYDAATDYFGYFESADWYAYNFASAKFEIKTADAANSLCASADFTRSGTVCVDIDTTVRPQDSNRFYRHR